MSIDRTSNPVTLPGAPKPCPFCGGLDLMAHHTWVACKTCGASGPGPKMFPENPRKAWNTRAADETAGDAELRKYVHQQIGFLDGGDDNKPAEALLRIAASQLKTSSDVPHVMPTLDKPPQ